MASENLRRDSPSTDSDAGAHADVGRRQQEEGPIILDFLLPANQDLSESMESPVRVPPLIVGHDSRRYASVVKLLLLGDGSVRCIFQHRPSFGYQDSPT